MISITSTFEIIATLNLDTGEEKVIRSCGIMKRGSFSDRNSISYENRVFAFLHDIVYKEDRENVYNELNKVKVALDYVQHDTWRLSSRGQFICPSCGGSNHSIDMNNSKSHKHSCDNCGLTLYYPWEL